MRSVHRKDREQSFLTGLIFPVRMTRVRRLKIAVASLAVAVMLPFALPANAASVTLTGTIRDFCAPEIPDSCTHLSDFEGVITDVVTNMTGTTLSSSGLPVAGPNISSGASSATNFAKWYTDSPGFNTSAPFSLMLPEGPSGTFSFSDSAFFPIDDMLFGNQDRSHNYHFTLHLEGLLSFSDPTPGPDKTFTFTGDDDLWIFVDGKRVIDLGGVHSAATASFTEETLKDLGLSAGTPYDLDIFFAERHTVASNFEITTTLDIAPPPPPEPVGEPASIALVALALAGLPWSRRWLA